MLYFDTDMEWLKTLKPGDDVGIFRNGYSTHPSEVSLATVASITPSGRINVDYVRIPGAEPLKRVFNPDGRERGNDYGGPRLVKPTDEFKTFMETVRVHNDLKYALFRFDGSYGPIQHVSIEDAKTVTDILIRAVKAREKEREEASKK